LRIYPNPTREQIFIEAPDPGTGMIELREVHGRIVLQSVLNNPSYALDVSALPSGIYTVRWAAGPRSMVGRFVKE
jgi:Secretion system C-terminal sorting domain